MTNLKSMCAHCHNAIATGTCPYCGNPICNNCLASVNASRICPLMVKK